MPKAPRGKPTLLFVLWLRLSHYAKSSHNANLMNRISREGLWISKSLMSHRNPQ